jgi:hypothetical protein
MFSGLAFKDVFPLNKPNFLKNKTSDFLILFRKTTTYFSLSDHHHAMITKILKVRCNAVQIKLMIWEPTRLTKLI